MEQLAREIHLDLIPVMKETWMMQPRIPQWALHVTHPNSILKVLNLAEKTIVHLGVPAYVFESIGASELASYWSIVMRQEWGSEPLRETVNPDIVMVKVAKAIAGSIFSMQQQSMRYRNFLQNGPPAGVQQFPKFSASERTKVLGVGWQWRTNAAQQGRNRQYESCVASQPRRAQSLRSQQCAPSDVLHPTLFL